MILLALHKIKLHYNLHVVYVAVITKKTNEQ